MDDTPIDEGKQCSGRLLEVEPAIGHPGEVHVPSESLPIDFSAYCLKDSVFLLCLKELFADELNHYGGGGNVEVQ